MPTNFTVVPVKDGAKKVTKGAEEEEEEEDNVLTEVQEDAAGEPRLLCRSAPVFHDFIRRSRISPPQSHVCPLLHVSFRKLVL